VTAAAAAVDQFVMRHGRGPRVLLIEDDRALGRMLTWTFEEQGALPVLARTCAEVQPMAVATPFDLALVDADLPDGDGIGLAETLATSHPNAIVAICSGRHGIRGLSRRTPAVDAILIKPVPIRLLLELLREACLERPDFALRMRQTRGAASVPPFSENTPCLNEDFSAWR
jgi:two-component system, OmpR family, response regulator